MNDRVRTHACVCTHMVSLKGVCMLCLYIYTCVCMCYVCMHMCVVSPSDNYMCVWCVQACCVWRYIHTRLHPKVIYVCICSCVHTSVDVLLCVCTETGRCIYVIICIHAVCACVYVEVCARVCVCGGAQSAFSSSFLSRSSD